MSRCEMCSICHEPLKRDVSNPIEVLGCTHVFHAACIEHAIDTGQTSARCPLCLQAVKNPARLATRSNKTDHARAAHLALYFLGRIASERDLDLETRRFSVAESERRRFRNNVDLLIHCGRNYYVEDYVKDGINRLIRGDHTKFENMCTFLLVASSHELIEF